MGMYDDDVAHRSANTHKEVCDLFNELLNELQKEYSGNNFEYGITGNKDGITERQRKHLHSYRERLNQIHIQ